MNRFFLSLFFAFCLALTGCDQNAGKDTESGTGQDTGAGSGVLPETTGTTEQVEPQPQPGEANKGSLPTDTLVKDQESAIKQKQQQPGKTLDGKEPHKEKEKK